MPRYDVTDLLQLQKTSNSNLVENLILYYCVYVYIYDGDLKLYSFR